MTDACGAGHPARRRISISALAVVALLVTACGSHPRAGTPSAAAYGSLPTFLPKASIQPDSVLTGSVARPALTAEGDGVEVQAATGAALATVSGPQVPGEGLPYQAEATTCTWTVTLAGATGRVPVTVADFSVLDHLGGVTPVALVPGQPVPPASISAGQTVSFELRTVIRTGEGLIRWSPGGPKILASWDFVVETD